MPSGQARTTTTCFPSLLHHWLPCRTFEQHQKAESCPSIMAHGRLILDFQCSSRINCMLNTRHVHEKQRARSAGYTLISGNGRRMPESSMQMLCARRCSIKLISLLLDLASLLSAPFSMICTSTHSYWHCPGWGCHLVVISGQQNGRSDPAHLHDLYQNPLQFSFSRPLTNVMLLCLGIPNLLGAYPKVFCSLLARSSGSAFKQCADITSTNASSFGRAL